MSPFILLILLNILIVEDPNENESVSLGLYTRDMTSQWCHTWIFNAHDPESSRLVFQKPILMSPLGFWGYDSSVLHLCQDSVLLSPLETALTEAIGSAWWWERLVMGTLGDGSAWWWSCSSPSQGSCFGLEWTCDSSYKVRFLFLLLSHASHAFSIDSHHTRQGWKD